ncbi:non-SMC mitotic condensation complex subunit 1, partial [Blyttiomyces helicus]
FTNQIQSVEEDIQENSELSFDQTRVTLEVYTFLWHWLVEVAEKRWKGMQRELERVATSTGKTKAQSAKAKAARKEEDWNWKSQKTRALVVVKRLLLLDLNRIVTAAAERDAIINMITKSVSLMLEDPDAVKADDTKQEMIHVLSLCVHKYERGLGHGVQTRVSREYLREENLVDFVVDLMLVLVRDYEDTRLVENVLRESADRIFTDKEPKVAKAFSKFLARLSDVLPKDFLKQMVLLQVHLDSESYSLRCGMLEAIGNLIHNLLVIDRSESARTSLEAYFEILQERFKDVNAFVRTRLLAILTRLAERRADIAITDIPIQFLPKLVSLTVGRLHDKSMTVRRQAMKLLTCFLQSTPYTALPQDFGKLSLKQFRGRKEDIDRLIKAKFPEEDIFGGETPATEDGDTPIEDARAPAAAEAELKEFRGLLRYYSDAIRFVEQVESAIPTLCELLASKTKLEAVEAMKFFV